MTRDQANALLAELERQGFDLSDSDREEEPTDVDEADIIYTVRPRCSQCEALCINGVATHEHGCPNAAAARHLQDTDDEDLDDEDEDLEDDDDEDDGDEPDPDEPDLYGV